MRRWRTWLRNVTATSRTLVLGAGAVALGLAAESAAFPIGDLRHWVPDLVVGWTFVACGLIGSSRRTESRIGALMIATGYSWFLGNFISIDLAPVAWASAHLLYLHRGFLVHSVLAFPDGRLTSRLDRGLAAIVYATSLTLQIPPNEPATIALSLALIAVAAWDFATAVGSVRRARALKLRAAVTGGAVLAGGAAARLAFPGGDANELVLLAYEAALVAVSLGLLIALLRARWERAAVTDLVIELAERRSGSLRDALARALGDPTMQVGYWDGERAIYVDAAGREVAVPEPDARRAVTPVEFDGRPVAVLLHDPAVRTDAGLLDSLSRAAALAASRARLQAQVREQLAAVRASRRRLVEAGDEERQRLAGRVRDGAEQRLLHVAEVLAAAHPLAESLRNTDAARKIERAQHQLARTIDDLHELAGGLHPSSLIERGLEPAIRELAAQSGIPVQVTMSVQAVPPELEAATYFLCAEALSNVVKHAAASRAWITISGRDGQLVVEFRDDGDGGVDVNRGSGLRGLGDRVAALGGRFEITSPVGQGTRLTAEIPLDPEPT